MASSRESRLERLLPHLVWSEPLAADPAQVSRGDLLLMATVAAIGIAEVAMTPALQQSATPALIGFAVMPTLLWRRIHPLWMVIVAFAWVTATDMYWRFSGQTVPQFNTTAFMLLLPYALMKWASGRNAMVGTFIMFGAASVNLLLQNIPWSDAIGGYAVLLAAMAVGVANRYRAHARIHELAQAKVREREQLARDLHDTVAHHVSAIAISAQAGLATAASDPNAAKVALELIETEASRALAEMRAMVKVLRHDGEASRAPQPTLADIQDLTSAAAEEPKISVQLRGEADTLPPAIGAALYRIAQESITNAQRHARGARSIGVTVEVGATSVTLQVRDDGAAQLGAKPRQGYGLIGMKERTELLGGRFEAGSTADKGWLVSATLPIDGGATAMTQLPSGKDR